MFYAQSTGGFYDTEIHGANVPADAVEISAEVHAAMLDGQSAGKLIVADESGYPALADPPPPEPVFKTKFTSLEFLDRFTDEEQLAVVQATMASAPVKLWYDRLLAASFVDLEDSRTEFGVDALINAGLLDAGRKAALMAPGSV